MKLNLRRIGLGIAGLVGLLIMLVAVLHFVGDGRLQKAPEIAVQEMTIPTDEAAIARGAHLATISSCGECHGADLGGDIFIEGPPFGYLPAPNLTAGSGGIGGSYSSADWDRAIRHGVADDGRAIMLMASDHYAAYSDEDLAALIAYLQSVPAVDGDVGWREIAFPGTVIFGVLGYSDAAPVAQIDHDAVGKAAPAAAETAAYGQYLVNIASCGSCHADDLGGNTDPNDGPLGPNITQGGELQSWSQADFVQAMRTGQTPEGTQLNEEMPWRSYAQMSDMELGALWAFVNSVPAQVAEVP